MKICLVSREVRPFVGGGLATYIEELARGLLAEGHEVHVLTEPFERLHEIAADYLPGVTFHATNVHEGPAALNGAYFCYPTRYSMAVYTALKSLHATHRFDYIEFPEYQGEGYWSLRAKRTLGHFADTVLGIRLHMPLYVCREFDRTNICNVEHAHVEHMEKWSVKEADLVLSASRAMLDRVTSDLRPELDRAQAHHSAPHIRQLRLPMDFSAMESKLCLGEPETPPPGEVRVLYYGRLQVYKGVQDLIAAAKLVLETGVNAKFVFIGGDTLTGPFGRSMKEYLERKCAGKFRDRFVFESARPRPELGCAIRGATVCCFPSLWESYSYACLEALACGAAIVASDGGSLKELIQPEVNGLTFRAGDPADCAEKLLRAINDASLRDRLRAAAPARARELSDARTIARALTEIVSEIAPACRTRAARLVPAPAKSNAPAVSVIIPFYNLGKYVRETLDSLKAQTFKDFELLIIDDGSAEPDSLKTLDDLRAEGFRVIRKENGGLGSARNVGFAEARAPWIVPMDADDIAHPTLIEKLVSAIRRDDDLSCVSPMFQSFYEKPDEAFSGYVPLALDGELLLYHNIAGPGAGSLLIKDRVLAAGGYDEWLTSFEDWDLWCTFAEKGFRGTVIPEFLLYYRLRHDSLIHSEAHVRWHALKAYLIKKHPSMARHPDIVLRMQLAETYQKDDRVRELEAHAARQHDRITYLENELARAAETESHLRDAAGAPNPAVDHAFAQAEAARLIRENLRYRLADRVNNALKNVGVQNAIRGATVKTIGAVKKVRGNG